jgi:hypothetical protein
MSDDRSAPGSAQFDRIAKDDFEHALRKSFWRSLGSWFTQSSNDLIPFDEVRRRLPLRGQHYIGLRQIALERVVGSVGRYNDFDRAFLPRRPQASGRGMSIDRAHLQDVILPPNEVYKIGENYFVKDGNHRVSVARERGQVFIDAYVIEIDISVPVGPSTDVDEIIRLQERAEFLSHTHLDVIRPGAEIELSLPGQYEKLLDHIKVHRWFMGEKLNREVPYDEAAASWYDEVYLPLVKTIRELGVLKDFPGRTETDLYLWIIEHLWYLRSELQQEISLKDAATHFADEYSTRPIRRLMHTFRRLGRVLSSETDSSDVDEQPRHHAS